MFYNLAERVELEWIQRYLDGRIVFSVRPHTWEWYDYIFNPYGGERGSRDWLRDLFPFGEDDEDEDYDLGFAASFEDEYMPQRKRSFPPKERDAGITEEKTRDFMRRWIALRKRANPGDAVIHVQRTTAIDGRNPYDEIDKWCLMAACETGGEYPGLPLAYDLFFHERPETADAQQALKFFHSLGLHPKRITAGSHLLDTAFFSMCDAVQMPWLIQMQYAYLGQETMVKRHEEELIQGHGTPITASEPMTAVCEDDVTLFSPSSALADRTGRVGIYCRTESARMSRDYLNEQLPKTFQEAYAVLEQIQSGNSEEKLTLPSTVSINPNSGSKETPVQAAENRALTELYFAVCKAGGQFYHPDSDVWDCLKLEYLPDGDRYRLYIDEGEVQRLRCRGNYIGLASSEPMELQAMYDDFPLSYNLDDDTFSAMHAQLNTEQPGSWHFSTQFFVAFLSDIVRALLLPSYRQFAAEKDGEIRAKEREKHTEEELKKEEPDVSVSIRKMIRWLDDLQFYHPYTEAADFTFRGSTEGVRGAVLQAAGIRPDLLPRFASLVNPSEDPNELKNLRQMMRTIPNKRGRPKGSKDKPKQDTGKG